MSLSNYALFEKITGQQTSSQLPQRTVETRSQQRPKSKEKTSAQFGRTNKNINEIPKIIQVSVEAPKKMHSFEKPKKKKKSKKKKRVDQKEVSDDEEQNRLEEENKRREELELFRKQQEEKMSKDERERLRLEQEELNEIMRRWEGEVYELHRKQMEQEEWDHYLAGNFHPNPTSEKDLSTFIYQLEEIQVSSVECQNVISKLEYSQRVLYGIQNQLMKERVINKFENDDYYLKYIKTVNLIINKKCEQITQQYIKYYEQFLEEHNQQLKKQGLPEFKVNNTKQILTNLANKPDDRQKYEILRYTPNSNTIRLGIWFNPISKAGYRVKPVEFSDLYELQIELPRLYMAQSLIYKVLWFEQDFNQDIRVYDQYLSLSGVFFPQLFEMVQLSKRRNRWTLKPSFEDPQTYMKQLQYPSLYGNQQLTNQQGIKISFKVPENFLLFSADNLYVVSKGASQKWTQEFTEDLKIQLDKRLVQFTLKGVYPFMLAQQRFADFPFQQWKLVQINESQAFLTIITARDIKIVIEIGLKNVKLIEPQISQLKEEMEPGIFFLELKQRGINLLAQEEDALCLHIPFKVNDVENQALINLMQGLNILSFQQSKWNRHSEIDTIIVQFIENPLQKIDVDNDDEFKWKTLEIGIFKCALIDASYFQFCKNYYQKKMIINSIHNGSKIP